MAASLGLAEFLPLGVLLLQLVLVIAILFFPFGLLALLSFRNDKATVSAHPTGDGTTRVRIVGTLRNQVSDTIDEVSEPLPL